MMFNPAFFRSPFYRRIPPPYYSIPRPNIEPVENINVKVQNQLNSDSKSSIDNSQNQDFSENNSQVFNILGITLYFDDILIICLLFFLYSEGVQDEMLFIALILLLIS